MRYSSLACVLCVFFCFLVFLLARGGLCFHREVRPAAGKWNKNKEKVPRCQNARLSQLRNRTPAARSGRTLKPIAPVPSAPGPPDRQKHLLRLHSHWQSALSLCLFKSTAVVSYCFIIRRKSIRAAWLLQKAQSPRWPLSAPETQNKRQPRACR